MTKKLCALIHLHALASTYMKPYYDKVQAGQGCYESPKKEIVSHAFEYLIYNLKIYNGVKI